MKEKERIVFQGSLRYEVFRSEDSLAIQQYAVSKTLEGEEIKEKRVTVSGYGLPRNKEFQYELAGEWVRHPNYGWQVKVTSFKEVIGDSKKAILDFLSKGPIRGVGPKTAEKIYAAFGPDTYKVLDKDPQRLYTVKGISETKASQIIQSWNENMATRDVMQLLLPLGVSVRTCMRLVKAFSYMTKEIILTNPWQLTECSGGLTFAQAEFIAQHEQLPMDSSSRVVNAMLAVLKENELCGHLGMGVAQFQTELRKKLLTIDAGKYSPELVKQYRENVLVEMSNQWNIQLRNKSVIQLTRLAGVPYIYRTYTFKAEFESACKLMKLMAGVKAPFAKEVDRLMERQKKDSKFPLAKMQEKAVRSSALYGVLVITGGPGTGKTTTVNEICRLCDYQKLSICLLAPTGKAAKRMMESTGRPARTVDSQLELVPDVDLDNGVTIDEDVTIVDEASMLDIFKLRSLLNAIKVGHRLILVGDIDQLPSVGPGAVLRDIIDSGNIPCIALDTVYRQKSGDDAGQRIIMNAHRINAGDVNLETGSGFSIEEVRGDEKIAERLTECYLEEVRKYGIDNVVCLLPTNKTKFVGVHDMNVRLQEVVNPPSANKSFITFGKGVFRQGDIIMNTRNDSDREVVNGEVGHIIQTDVDSDKVRSVVNDFDGREVEFKGTEAIQQLTLAYAMTVHKSQGSEYASVIIGMSDSIGKVMEKRNLLYTGVTRAKKQVKIVGSLSAVRQSIQTVDSLYRQTCLSFMIRVAAAHYRH